MSHEVYAERKSCKSAHAAVLGLPVNAKFESSCFFQHSSSTMYSGCCCMYVCMYSRNKSPGIDVVMSEMIKDDGDVLHNCLLVIFNFKLMV